MKHKKKAPGDISEDPDMIELERMIAAGELDGDRVTRHADEEPEKKSERKRSFLEINYPNCMVGNEKEYHGKGGRFPIKLEYPWKSKVKRRSGNSHESSEERAGGD